jgi:aromatic ring hydroxylase
MKAATYIQRCVGIIALAALSAANGLGSSKKSRVFNAQFEAVWSAVSTPA